MPVFSPYKRVKRYRDEVGAEGVGIMGPPGVAKVCKIRFAFLSKCETSRWLLSGLFTHATALFEKTCC